MQIQKIVIVWSPTLKHLLSTCLLVPLFALLSLSMNQQAFAHGADDHEHAEPAAPLIALAPRAIAQTEELELVIVLQGRHLVIYADRFTTNEAVLDAQIEIESGTALKAMAKQISPGVYSVDLPQGVFEKDGKYPLSITVQAGDLGDVMNASLEIGAVAEAHDHDVGNGKTWKMLALIISALVIVTLAFVFIRRRQNQQKRIQSGAWK